MELTSQNGAARPRVAFAIALLVTAIAASAAAFIDIAFAFAPFAALAVLIFLWSMKLGKFLPATPVGWLYALIIFITCWAPSLGTIGTIARFALAGVSVLVLIHSFYTPCQPLNRPLKIGLAILLLSLAISSIAAASAGYGLSRLLNWTMFIPLVWLAFRKPDIRGASFGLVSTGVFQMLGVGLQMAGLMKGTWGGLLTAGATYNPETSSWLKRYTGFILNPNNLALVLSCAVIVLAAAVLARGPGRAKAGFLVLMALFVVGIVLTGSRGGLVALGIGVALVFLKAGRRGIALGVATVGFGAIAYSISGSQELDRLFQSFTEIIIGTDASAAQRSGVWLTRFQSAEHGNPILGSGFGGYAPELFANQQGLDVDPALARQATVDNSWLKILLESGILGLIGMALASLTSAWTALTRSTADRRLWGIAAGAAIVAMIWRSISVDMLDQNPWNAILFLAIGLAAASTAVRPHDLPTPPPVAAQRRA